MNNIKKIIDDVINGIDLSKRTGYGEVVSVYDGVCTVSGLTDVQIEEVVVFKRNNTKGMVISLDENFATVLILSEEEIRSQDEVESTGEFFKIKISEEVIGRVLDGFGRPIDGKGPINGQYFDIDQEAVPMIGRAPVKTQIVTGIKIIDWLTPVGLGQRQLILGDLGTGKSSIAQTIMLNQKNNPNMISIYVSIGKKINHCAKVLSTLLSGGVKNFVLIQANNSDSAAMRYIAPLVGCAIGEYFRDKGKNAVIIYNSLSAQAIAYRNISLILKRTPGREAYPGDIFYLHSKLLERSCNLAGNKGSLTAFPIVETAAGDITGYISTNVVSITDGQIFTSADEFAKNFKPAIKTNMSVSRVGSDCQHSAVKKLCGSLKMQLAQYEEYVEFSKFSSDVSDEIQRILDKGSLVKRVLQQEAIDPVPLWKQVLLLFGLKYNYITKSNIEEFEKKINNLEKDSNVILSGNEDQIKVLLEKL